MLKGKRELGQGEAGALFWPSCAAAGLYTGAMWAVGDSVELEDSR